MNTEPTGLELVPRKPCFPALLLQLLPEVLEAAHQRKTSGSSTLTTIPHEEVTPPCDSETVSLSGVTFATETTMQETQPNNG